MSMGMVLTIPDGAVLVSDGRNWAAFCEPSFIINNDMDKLQPLTETGSAFAVGFGLDFLADSVMEAIRDDLEGNENCEPEVIFDSLKFHLESEWRSFLDRLPVGVNPNGDALGVGVYCAGLAGGVPFFATAMHHQGLELSANFGKGPGKGRAIGFEDAGDKAQFYADIKELFSKTLWEPSIGPLNNYVEQLIARSAAAIRLVESQSGVPGGTIRYAVVRKDFPVKKAIWEDRKGKKGKDRKIGAIAVFKEGAVDLPDLPSDVKPEDVEQEIVQILSDAGMGVQWFKENADGRHSKPTPDQEKALLKVAGLADAYYKKIEDDNAAIAADFGTITTSKINLQSGKIELGASIDSSQMDGMVIYEDTNPRVRIGEWQATGEYGIWLYDNTGTLRIKLAGSHSFIQDSSGTDIFDTNFKFHGMLLIEQGTCGSADSGSGVPDPIAGTWYTNVWSSVSKTVPTGKKWIVLVNTCAEASAYGSGGFKYDGFTRGDWEGFEWAVGGRFYTGTLYGGVLPAGSHTGLTLAIDHRVCLYAGLAANDAWATQKVFWAVYEIPA